MPPTSALPSSPAERQGSLLSPPVVRILAVQMAFGLSYSAFLLLPKYLRVTFSASATTIGWVASSAVLAAAVFAPIVGIQGARWPRRVVLGAGMGAASLAALGFGWLDAIGPELYLLRALQGFAWAAITNVTATLMADCVPQSRLAQAIGYLGLSMLVTNALAPAVTEPLAEAWGWAPVFWGVGALTLLAFLFFPGLPAETRDPREIEPSRSEISSSRQLSVYYASLLMGAGIGVMFTFTQPFALERGATRVGDFFFGYVAAAVFVRVFLARLADSVGPGKISSYALALYSVVVLVSSELRPSWLIPLGAGLGTCHGILYPALTAAGLSGLTQREQSAFLGWYSSAFNVGFAITVLLLGPLADRHGFRWVFCVVGLWLATGVAPLYATHRTRRAELS